MAQMGSLQRHVAKLCSHFEWIIAGENLEPDEITFAILLRGYGNQKPPSWSQITGLMNLMVSRYNCQPDIGKQ